MQITWLGHACFKIQAKNNGEGITIITDPFDNSIGLKIAKQSADIVTISHQHYDHNNLGAIKLIRSSKNEQGAFLIETPGEYEIKGVFIQGIPSFHDKKQGADRGINTIYRFEIEGISLAHLGDLGHILNDEQLEKLQGIDIVFIPVGGKYTIDGKEAAEVIQQIEPRIVIPMHYKVPELKLDIDKVDNFLKEIGIKEEKLDKLKIVKKDLPQDKMRVILLNYK